MQSDSGDRRRRTDAIHNAVQRDAAKRRASPAPAPARTRARSDRDRERIEAAADRRAHRARASGEADQATRASSRQRRSLRCRSGCAATTLRAPSRHERERPITTGDRPHPRAARRLPAGPAGATMTPIAAAVIITGSNRSGRGDSSAAPPARHRRPPMAGDGTGMRIVRADAGDRVIAASPLPPSDHDAAIEVRPRHAGIERGTQRRLARAACRRREPRSS